MSKLKAALVTLFLGTSTAAMAAPTVTFSANAELAWASFLPSMPSVRDHRTSEPSWQMPSNRTTWTSLASSLGLADGRDVVRVQRGMDINSLRLTATYGNTYVGKLTLKFADGTRQVMNVNRWLTRTPIELALAKCDVTSITVTGSAARNTSYQMFASTDERAELPTPPIYQPPQPPVYQPPVYQPQTVMLSSQLNFANTTGYRLVQVGANRGTFATLRLQEHNGTLPLEKVVVNFANGEIQTIDNIHRMFSTGEYIDLRLDARGGGKIAQVYVFTNNSNSPVPSDTSGTFDLIAI